MTALFCPSAGLQMTLYNPMTDLIQTRVDLVQRRDDPQAEPQGDPQGDLCVASPNHCVTLVSPWMVLFFSGKVRPSVVTIFGETISFLSSPHADTSSLKQFRHCSAEFTKTACIYRFLGLAVCLQVCLLDDSADSPLYPCCCLDLVSISSVALRVV